MDSSKNKFTYNSPIIVQHYKSASGLQQPENTILEILRNKLSEMKMLDIGVGAGRTTNFFGPLVKEYMGIDYSEQMIRHCKELYKKPNVLFETKDLRTLSTFPDKSYDFILISFNSIDYISAIEREEALKQIKRILAPQGYFCFSTHNILSVENLHKFVMRKNLFKVLKTALQKIRFRKMYNVGELIRKPFETINDGTFNFGLQTFYINPHFQIESLLALGFRDIKIFNLSEGTEITREEAEKSKDFYLYYLCRN